MTVRPWLRVVSAVWLTCAVGGIGLPAAELWLVLAEERMSARADAYRSLHWSVYDTQPYREAIEESLWRSRDEIFLAYRPGASLKIEQDGQLVSVVINSRGFRTHEFVVPHPPDVVRVVCIGGSTTVQGLTNEQTYPAFLEQALRRRFGPQVEVLNLGISGVASDHWLDRTDELFALQPDVVVQYEGVNDIAWKTLAGYAADHPGRVLLRRLRCLRPLLPIRPESLADRLSRAVANQQEMRRRCDARGVRHVAATFAAPDASRATPEFRALLDQNVRRVWGLPVHLGTFQEYGRLLDAYNGLVSDAAARGSLTVANVRDVLRDPRLFTDACHMTREGTTALAAAFETAVGAAVATQAAHGPQPIAAPADHGDPEGRSR